MLNRRKMMAQAYETVKVSSNIAVTFYINGTQFGSGTSASTIVAYGTSYSITFGGYDTTKYQLDNATYSATASQSSRNFYAYFAYYKARVTCNINIDCTRMPLGNLNIKLAHDDGYITVFNGSFNDYEEYSSSVTIDVDPGTIDCIVITSSYYMTGTISGDFGSFSVRNYANTYKAYYQDTTVYKDGWYSLNLDLAVATG